jgi:EAL domain-containing protein (putative c-di-GMP-specific phosphodiesterase class I)
LNNENIVTAGNAEHLLEAMREATADELREKHEAQLENERQTARASLRKVSSEVTRLSDQVAAFQLQQAQALALRESQLKGVVNSLKREAKTLGVQIAMDDFGTGYSSLYNLRVFPFDKIKIDHSFIKCVDSNEQAATIVRAVVGLGHGLGLPVLAEGVETAGELEFLSNEKCDEVQGYMLGRPAEIRSFRGLIHPEVPAEQRALSRAPTATVAPKVKAATQ